MIVFTFSLSLPRGLYLQASRADNVRRNQLINITRLALYDLFLSLLRQESPTIIFWKTEPFIPEVILLFAKDIHGTWRFRMNATKIGIVSQSPSSFM